MTSGVTISFSRRAPFHGVNYLVTNRFSHTDGKSRKSWRWRQHGPRKHWYLTTALHSVDLKHHRHEGLKAYCSESVELATE